MDCLPYTLQWDVPFPLKIVPSYGGSGPPSNAWFSGPTRVLNPIGISIGSAVFAGLTSVTDRPTDHATRSVTIDRVYCTSKYGQCGVIIMAVALSRGLESGMADRRS